jgi:hypothetical protein
MKTTLEPKYAELKALVKKAVTINADIRKLKSGFRAAMEAGDTVKAQTLLDQLMAKKGELKDNLALRVALTRTKSGYRATNTETWIKGIKSPVAVTVGPDGAVYVGDWARGTVYRIAENPES